MIHKIISEHLEVQNKILNDRFIHEQIRSLAEHIKEAFTKGNRVFFCGNGGSAADAQHIAAELSGRFQKNRKALPAEALHTNSSYITAVANDIGFEHIYSRLIDGIAKEGDIICSLSTSGNSSNIIEAMRMARSKNIYNVLLTGINGGEAEKYADLCIRVPSQNTARIQESHILIGHIICQLVEDGLFKDI